VHVRWLTPLEKHALCAVKRKTVTGVAAGADAEEVYILFAGAIHEKSMWILCDCLPDGFERAVIVPCYVEGRMSLRNLPNAEVPHAANCIFRLRERDEEAAEHDPRFLFNPVPRDEYEPDMPGHEPDPETGTRWRRRPPPTVAHVLKCFVQEARLNTLAVAQRFASPAEWLPEIRRAAGKFPVAPDIPASEVLFTDPACLGSGEIPERLDAAAERWPDPQSPRGFLCWVADEVDDREIRWTGPQPGHLGVSSRVTSPMVFPHRVIGPYLFLGVVAPSGDPPGWKCRAAYAQPIAAPELPIPVESDYERQALRSLPRLVRDLGNDAELREALGGAVRVELARPLFPFPVSGGECLPDAVLTVTRPGGHGHRPGEPEGGRPDGPFEDRDTARYVFEVMGFDNEAYERKKEETHDRMRRIGRVIRLEGPLFRPPYSGLERQLGRIAGQIARDLRWRWKTG